MLNFLYFQWTEIDWLKWMPVELAGLLFLILVIRGLRRRNRWKNVEVSHVDEGNIDFKGEKYLLYTQIIPILAHSKPLNPENKVVDDHTPSLSNKRLLYIQPLSGWTFKNDVFPKSISLLGFDVMVMTRNNLGQFLEDTSFNHALFHEFLRKFNIEYIISFDYSNPIMLNFIHIELETQAKDSFLASIKWIFIRPTITYDAVLSVFHFLPLSLRWGATLKLKRFLKHQKLFFQFGKSKVKDWKDLSNKIDVYYIIPNKHWLTKIETDSLMSQETIAINEQNTFNDHFFHIDNGDWDFYRNETILIGIIYQISILTARTKLKGE
jgi:hypothetical protein